jgi:hypothetical protein
MHERTHDSKAFRILNLIDEYSRECHAAAVNRKLNHQDEFYSLIDLFCERGVTVHLLGKRSGVHCQAGANMAK